MSDTRRQALIEMAKSYFWRLEIESYQAFGFVQGLEALGLLDEMQAVEIHDHLNDIFPEEDADILDECKWELNEAQALWTCIKNHECPNKMKHLKEVRDGKGSEAQFGLGMES